MALVSVKVVVSPIGEVIKHFDRVKVYRQAILTGSPTEITTPSTRIALLADTTVYTYDDLAGDTTAYYRVSYLNTTTSAESTLSDPIQGEGDPALEILTPDELRTNYLFGIDLTDDFGNEMPDSVLTHYVKAAVSWVELRLDLYLRPTTILDERHDFVANDYRSYLFLVTDYTPVISVEKLRMVLPNEVQVLEAQADWIHVDKSSGQISIVPGVGAAPILTSAAVSMWSPIFRVDLVPEVFRIDYTAGFASGRCPAAIKELVGKVAAMGPLNIAGDLILGAGMASKSTSIDGLSQTLTSTASAANAGFGARVKQYGKEIDEAVKFLRRYYQGQRMTVA